MKIIRYPERAEWKQIVQRPQAGVEELYEKVKHILKEVKEGGDEALRKFTREFDGADLAEPAVGEDEIREAAELVSGQLKSAIDLAAANIEKFHLAQLPKEEVIETMPGVKCWRKAVGIDKVGIYIPGGTAPLFSTILMLAIPARIAGCGRLRWKITVWGSGASTTSTEL